MLITAMGIFLFTSSCSNTKYYNRWNKEKACKMETKGSKKAKKH